MNAGGEGRQLVVVVVVRGDGRRIAASRKRSNPFPPRDVAHALARHAAHDLLSPRSADQQLLIQKCRGQGAQWPGQYCTAETGDAYQRSRPARPHEARRRVARRRSFNTRQPALDQPQRPSVRPRRLGAVGSHHGGARVPSCCFRAVPGQRRLLFARAPTVSSGHATPTCSSLPRHPLCLSRRP
jgi:hypothetical protein